MILVTVTYYHKKNIKFVLLSALIFCNTIVFSQSDSLSRITEIKREKSSFFDVAWAPVAISLISIDLMRDSAKYGLQHLIRQPFNGYHTEIDDYIQYVPILTMYAADLFKVPAKNTVWNQTKFLAMSEL